MKKKLASLLGIALAGAMILAGCGETGSSSAGSAAASNGTTATASAEDTANNTLNIDTAGTDADITIGEENTEAEAIEMTIAFACWGYSDTLSMGYQKALNSISKGLMTLDQPIKVNWEWVTCYSPEEELTNLEAIHEKGVDGMVVLYMSEAIIDAMNSWEMPFVCYTICGDEIEAYAQQSPYYVGTVHEAIPDQAERQIRYAIETLGCKEILLMSFAPGIVNHDIRFPRYEAVEAEYPDVTVYTNRSDEQPVDVVNSMLTMHPNIDCIIDTSALGGRGDGVVQALRTNNLGHGEVKYITCDFVEDQVNAMNDGIIAFTSSGTQGSVTHAFVALLNKIMGTPLSEDPMIWTWAFVDMTSVEDYENFNKYCIGKVPMITFEDYEPYFRWIHPEASAEGFIALCTPENLNLETIMEKHASYFQ